MFEIEKGIPVSVARMSWPFKDMEVGDSVLFEDPLIAKKAQTHCHVHGAQSGRKFATRKEGNGIRVWRVA